MRFGRRVTILIGLVISLLVPLLPLIPGGRAPSRIPGLPPFAGREAFWWILVCVVLLYVAIVERRPLLSIGLRRPDWRTWAFGIAGGIVIVAGVGGLMGLLLPVLHLHANEQAVQNILDTPYAQRIMIVARAGIAEELLFRGYGIERLRELTGSRFVAAIVTLAAFTVGHLSYWGWTQLIIAGGAGLVLTVLYLWRRDLVCNMIAHLVTDAAGLLLR